ncbi:MAG: hypothetical protein P4L71_19530 [Acetobacteraceae bacterium]|nr:hypothetical protein [Acetobacteraceae bacterium]
MPQDMAQPLAGRSALHEGPASHGAPAVAAAVVAGGAVGGGIFAISSVANAGEQDTRDADTAAGRLMLAVRAPTPARQAEAEAILRAAGGTDLMRS